MDMNKISIVTVTYNDAQGLRKTLESIKSQTYKNFECLIIDGGSTDNTMQIINEYEPKFNELGINFLYKSEKDNGIYDAMNKGIALAKGMWTIFMNGGDCFYSAEVLDRIFSQKYSPDIDILYGRWVTVYKDQLREGTVYLVDKEDQQKHCNLKCTKNFPTIGKMISSHQAVFFKTALLQMRKYNIEYKIVADFEWCMYAYLKGYKFKFIDEFVCKFEFGGISSLKLYNKNKESVRVRHFYGTQDFIIIEKGKLLIWLLLEKIIKLVYK